MFATLRGGGPPAQNHRARQDRYHSLPCAGAPTVSFSHSGNSQAGFIKCPAAPQKRPHPHQPEEQHTVIHCRIAAVNASARIELRNS